MIESFWKSFFYLFICCLPSVLLQANVEPIMVNESFKELMLGHSELGILIDDEGAYQLDDVLKIEDTKFVPLEKAFRFTNMSSPYWLKMILVNEDTMSRKLLLEVVNTYLHKFQLHTYRSGEKVISDTLGTAFPISRRSHMEHNTNAKHRNFQFTFDLEIADTLICFLYFPSFNKYPLNGHIYMWDEPYRTDIQQERETVILTIFFSLCMVYLIILGSALYITQLSYYWYYFWYVLLGVLFVLTDLQLGYRYLWGEMPYIQYTAPVIILNLYIIMGIMFVRKHFETRRFFKYIDILLRINMVVMSLFILLSFWVLHFSDPFSIFLYRLQKMMLISTCIIFFYLLFLSIFRSHKVFSGLFLFGFSLHGLSAIFGVIINLGWFQGGSIPELLSIIGYPLTFYTQVTLMLGMLLEMVVIFYIGIVGFTRLYDENALLISQIALDKQKKMNSLTLGIESERRRVAQDLHDGLGGLLSATKHRVNSLRTMLNKNDKIRSEITPNITNVIDDIIGDLDASNKQVREISHNLMPTPLYKRGLIVAIEEIMYRIRTVNENLKINFYHNLKFDEAKELSIIYLYRIVNELLNNVSRHAQAKQVSLQFVKLEDHLLITIEDDGIGFNNIKDRADGIGMKNITYRVSALDGKMDVDSNMGRGTFISIEIPLESVF